jgi:hypothetical protein
MTISTHDLSGLPDVLDLKSLCQSMALLDAILCPTWEYRYYSFNSNWGKETALASMRDGQGDHYFCVFTSRGAVLKGFAHESAMSPFRSDPPRIWPGVLDGVPSIFRKILNEPSLAIEETTFCIWRGSEDPVWRRGDIRFPDITEADGSAGLLELLDGRPRTYCQWARMYYEREVDLDPVMHIYRHEPLTDEIIRALNPDVSLQDLKDDLAEIGYA